MSATDIALRFGELVSLIEGKQKEAVAKYMEGGNGSREQFTLAKDLDALLLYTRNAEKKAVSIANKTTV